ncbi:UDP-glycosyltransferase 13-like [Salvia miltiorrhiza]|uniref:UDP-glycosyltransferase 13-like n=1 Tax=Salvia miltiorrhiza TaxID=226208 RepID=UPI0025AC6D2E|nr:UDP-glycosyltransferase 13-like [Salvia miltiorrhiza]
MGQLIPFFRFAANLHSRGAITTIITVEPTVSAAESDCLSNFVATFPHIKCLQLHLLPHKKSQLTNDDPFFIQWSASPTQSISYAFFPLAASLRRCRRSPCPHPSPPPRLPPHLHTHHHLPQIILHHGRHNNDRLKVPHNNDRLKIPNLGSIPVSSIPPPLLDLNHYFAVPITTNTAALERRSIATFVVEP